MLTAFEKMRANRRRMSGETPRRRQLMLALLDELEAEEVATWGQPDSLPPPDPPAPRRRLFWWLSPRVKAVG